MKTTAKVSTWLELATVPHSKDRRVTLCVHPLQGNATGVPKTCKEKCCYAISVDGRWLHASDGRLTILSGMEAVDRFMCMIKLPTFEPGEPLQIEADCGKTAYCIAACPDAGLRDCA